MSLIVLPATLSGGIDGPEDYWLALRNDDTLKAAIKKARGLKDCLRERGLMRAIFMAHGVFPVGGILWGDEPLQAAAGALMTPEKLARMEAREAFTLETDDLAVPEGDLTSVRLDNGEVFMAAELLRHSFEVEVYDYPKYAGGRAYATLLSESAGAGRLEGVTG